MIINETTYHDSTPPAVAKILDRARLSRFDRTSQRLRLFYGDPDTGRDWLEEFDTLGYIGRSTGTVGIPLLIHNSRSLGGGAVLDHCIVKIVDTGTRQTLYQHPTYTLPALTVNLPDLGESLFSVLADGEVCARFATEDAANRFIAYMKGERFNK